MNKPQDLLSLAQAAKDFHTLHSSAYAQRWGLVRHLPKLHDAAQVVAQIGERM